jgi:hypothetical protein
MGFDKVRLISSNNMILIPLFSLFQFSELLKNIRYVFILLKEKKLTSLVLKCNGYVLQIVNVFALWSIMLTTDFSQMTWNQTSIYVISCSVIIGFEFVLGVVRVQDYFRSYYLRLVFFTFMCIFHLIF